jgi:hypothetical protein
MTSIKVTSIKNNIQVGTLIPTTATETDNGVGHWADDKIENNGHYVDRAGIVDLPNIGVENKTKKRKTNAAWSQGSITVKAIKSTVAITDTRVWSKMKNQNQIIWDESLQKVIEVGIINMDIEEIRDLLQEGWEDVRQQVMKTSGDENRTIKKNITSKNKAVVLDGYNSDTSYNIRIPNTAMNKIRSISRTKNSIDRLFDHGE